MRNQEGTMIQGSHMAYIFLNPSQLGFSEGRAGLSLSPSGSHPKLGDITETPGILKVPIISSLLSQNLYC